MVTTAYLQKVQTVKCRPNLYDNLERQIVVIIHLLKQEGILCTSALYGYCTWLVKRTHSDGSSPVTTTHLLLHHFFSYTKGFISMQAYWFVRIDMPFLSIINQTIYNMDKNKIHGFTNQLNLFLIGAVIGGIVGSCFSINAVKGKSNKAEEKVRAYEQYYKCTETLLDSLDGTHDLDLMDTDLETDYGVDYLEAKSKVDELIAE